ncbi:MAG: hypothetical protein V3W51_05115, partial [Candidatus Brocadiales bacterium]
MSTKPLLCLVFVLGIALVGSGCEMTGTQKGTAIGAAGGAAAGAGIGAAFGAPGLGAAIGAGGGGLIGALTQGNEGEGSRSLRSPEDLDERAPRHGGEPGDPW